MERYQTIMVCVTRQKTCERLISEAYQLDPEAHLHVVNVIPEDGRFMDDPNEGEALEYLFDISKKYHADMTVLKSADVLQTLADYANDNHADCVVIGKSPTDDGENSFLFRLQRHLKCANLVIR